LTPSKHLHILLVDDNRFDRELASAALHEAGVDGCSLEIGCAPSWEDAKPLLDAGGIDLILLDFNLPGLSGLDILRQLAGTPHPPVVMLTGQDDVGTAVETLRAGAYDYVRKSVDWGPALSCAVERALARVRLERQLAEARERLAAHAADLEQKVTTRTSVVRMQAAKIEELYLAAERTARVKFEIVADVSHEVRTLLNVILGYTDILRDEIRETEPSAMLARVRTQAEQLRTLAESLLALDRLDEGIGQVAVSPFDLGRLVADLSAEADALNSDRGLRLEWTVLPPEAREILHDRDKTWAIAYHLVSNAIKFTPEGRVEVTFMAEADGGLTISVSDTGIGLPSDAGPVTHEELRQLDGSNARPHDGLGLGIVRRYANLLGGRMTVAERPGGGTTFTVALPAPPAVKGPAGCARAVSA
jgi:signal transduction histidine kinase